MLTISGKAQVLNTVARRSRRDKMEITVVFDTLNIFKQCVIGNYKILIPDEPVREGKESVQYSPPSPSFSYLQLEDVDTT